MTAGCGLCNEPIIFKCNAGSTSASCSLLMIIIAVCSQWSCIIHACISVFSRKATTMCSTLVCISEQGVTLWGNSWWELIQVSNYNNVYRYKLSMIISQCGKGWSGLQCWQLKWDQFNSSHSWTPALIRAQQMRSSLNFLSRLTSQQAGLSWSFKGFTSPSHN